MVYLNSEIIHIGKGTTENIWTDLQRLILIEKSTRKFYKKYGLYYQYFIIRPVQLVYLLFHEPHLFFITLKAIAKSLFK
ncbi:MAG: hypothetical protein FJY07_01805 [Bacteroidetes bacterium]|nr:hypothetical protein [Bacteroidota bacterium]